MTRSSSIPSPPKLGERRRNLHMNDSSGGGVVVKKKELSAEDVYGSSDRIYGDQKGRSANELQGLTRLVVRLWEDSNNNNNNSNNNNNWDEAKNFVDQKESKSANSRRLKTTMAASGGGGGADGDEQTNPNSSVQPGLGGHGGRGHGGSGHHHHHHTGRHRRHKHGSGHGGNDVGLPLPERKLSPFEEKSEHSASPPGRSGPPPTKPKPINPMLHQQNSDERRMAYAGSELNPDQDSLDGQMPSGRSMLVSIEPARNTSPGGPEPSSSNPNGGPQHSSSAIGSNFTKGPSAKHKKHRKLNREQSQTMDSDESSDGENEDEGETRSTKQTGVPGSNGSPSKSNSPSNRLPSKDSSTKGSSGQLNGSPSKKKSSSSSSTKTNKSQIQINPFSGLLWERREPFSHLWVALSSMYGKILVLLMVAFCLTEVLDNKIRPLAFQGIFMMYLYVGSIVAIMCIYISVLLDNCPSISKSSKDHSADPESGSVSSFGTLRRAHIDRNKVSRTSFYLRVGALVFGLGTLIFIGLEIAMHATMENNCVEDIVIAHPILQALFTFLQMHFLFVNSQVIVERFGLFARFGFMHLVATNLALWVRTIIWESANEWIHHLYKHRGQSQAVAGGDVFSTPLGGDGPLALAMRGNPRSYSDNYFSDRSFTNVENDYVIASDSAQQIGLGSTSSLSGCNSSLPMSPEHIDYVVSMYTCFNNNTLGKLWTSSMPYLFPFIVEYRIKIELHFSLIAAAVTYIMWKHVGNDKIPKVEGKRKKMNDGDDGFDSDGTLDPKKRRGYWRVDCQGASKGLFMGLLCLVGGIIILIIFFVMKDTPEFTDEMFWIFTGAEIAILSMATFGCIGGFVQFQKLSHSFRKPYDLDNLLSSVTIIGAYIYAIFSMIAAGVHLGSANPKSIAVFVQNTLLLIQVSCQGMIIAEASRRICATRGQQSSKPGRQLVTFLLFANITLWILDTFMTHNWITQALQLNFYGLLAWGIVSRISLPLLIFYRFHSCVVLVEIWKNTYRTKEAL